MSRRTKAFRAGKEAGRAAGSWVLDGNSSLETAARILKGFDECDPEIMDMQPSPLSGEWAGESIPELSACLGIDLNDDDKATDFEDGYSEGYWDEVQRACKAMLEDTGLCPVCGKLVSLNGTTTTGNLIGSCGDSFSRAP